MSIASHAVLSCVLVAAQVTLESPLPARLTAADLQTRAAAVQELQKSVDETSYVPREPGLQEAIVRSLEIENEVISENLRQFKRSRKSNLGEEFAEHYAVLLGLADRMRRDAPPEEVRLMSRLLRALVMGAYNPDSEFAAGLAQVGEAIVPFVLELTRSQNDADKWNGYSLTAGLLENHYRSTLANPLSMSSRYNLQAAARQGLLDPAADVRLWAVPAVVAAKDKGAIPLLRKLAESDPDRDKGAVRYSVRSAAADAIAALERMR